MANYMGIYRQEVFRLMHELQENGKLDFLDAETEPKKTVQPDPYIKPDFIKEPKAYLEEPDHF
ncbi:MAG: hypothetical protein Q8888_02480 [Vigna little leaf phytoplasma]|nr:hypothetical protein [Vigna little leaf phytoplasma]